MHYIVRASSADRGWSGLDAAVRDTAGGPIVHPASPRFNVGMLIGEPVEVACRCEGAIQRYLQVPGDIHVVPAGNAVLWEDGGPARYLGIGLTPSLVRSAAESMHVNLDCITLAPQTQLRDEKIKHIALAIKSELGQRDPYDRMYAEGLGLALAVHLLRRYSRREGASYARGLSGKQLQHVKDYVHEHLASDLSLNEVASVTGISPSHFKALFKQSMGLPVHKYVMRCRVERAIELIANGQVKLSEVALRAGFADQSHMSRWLRRFVGLTPAQVKRSVN